MLNLRKLGSLKIVQDTGQLLKNWVLWARLEESSVHAGSVEGTQEQHLPLLQLGAGSAKQGLHSLLPISMGPRAEEVQVSLL